MCFSELMTFLGAGQYSTCHSLLLTAAYTKLFTSCVAQQSPRQALLCWSLYLFVAKIKFYMLIENW